MLDPEPRRAGGLPDPRNDRFDMECPGGMRLTMLYRGGQVAMMQWLLGVSWAEATAEYSPLSGGNRV